VGARWWRVVVAIRIGIRTVQFVRGRSSLALTDESLA
jgi:hypothetical protein